MTNMRYEEEEEEEEEDRANLLRSLVAALGVRGNLKTGRGSGTSATKLPHPWSVLNTDCLVLDQTSYRTLFKLDFGSSKLLEGSTWDLTDLIPRIMF